MSWNDLADSIRPTQPPPHVNLVLCGRAAAKLPRLPGPSFHDNEVITFHRAQYASNDGDVTGVLDVIRLAIPEQTLLKHVVIDEGLFVTVIALDWLEDVSSWPGMLDEALQMVPEGSKLIFTAVNFKKATQLWRSSAVLSEKIDTCHQFLRVNALKHKASIIYTIGTDDDIDWLAVISHTTDIAFTSRSAPAEQLVADPVFAVYDTHSIDTKEHILALNPMFDYDAAFENRSELQSLVDPEPPGDEPTELSFEAILAEFDEKNHGIRTSEDTTTESHKLVYDGIEDRKVISEFFTKIAQHSS